MLVGQTQREPNLYKRSEQIDLSFETAVVNKKLHKTSGGNGKRDTPVSIPNTEVKPLNADGTWVVTPWESRTLPDIKYS